MGKFYSYIPFGQLVPGKVVTAGWWHDAGHALNSMMIYYGGSPPYDEMRDTIYNGVDWCFDDSFVSTFLIPYMT